MRFGIIANREREGAKEALNTLISLLRDFRGAGKCTVWSDILELVEDTSRVTVAASLAEVAGQSDVLFSLGGDGTMLAAARAIIRSNPKCRLIGVNLGKLGFIAENPPSDLQAIILALKEDRLETDKRLLLAATVQSEREAGAPTSLIALNDIVIDNFKSTRMLTFEINVDDELLGIMRADGLIIATPTGSTGYAVSAGGPIVEPSSPVMLITPIAPHSLNVRPIIVPDSVTISVRAFSDETPETLIVADGQEEAVVASPARITVTRAKDELQLLRKAESSYFELLRAKLYWSHDARDKGSSRH